MTAYAAPHHSLPTQPDLFFQFVQDRFVVPAQSLHQARDQAISRRLVRIQKAHDYVSSALLLPFRAGKTDARLILPHQYRRYYDLQSFWRMIGLPRG